MIGAEGDGSVLLADGPVAEGAYLARLQVAETDAQDQRLHDDLFAFLRIPSVSARSEHRGDVRDAAAWLHAQCARIGMTVETLETPGHPIVLAEWRKAPKGAPTVLIYGHLRAYVLGGSQMAAHLIGIPFVFVLPFLLALLSSRRAKPIGA